MSFTAIIHELALPPETRVEQRVPKKLFVENDTFTAGDGPAKRVTYTPL